MENTIRTCGYIRLGTVLLDTMYHKTLIVTAILDYYYCGKGKYILLQDRTDGSQSILEYDSIYDRILNGMFNVIY